MRRTHRARPSGEVASLQITPLIDIVFLLLTYFLFTISLSTIEGLLRSELALGNQADEQQLDQELPENETVLRIVQTGERVQYFVDDWPVSDYEAVAEHLAALARNATIVIDAGPSVTYDHVVRLYNRCLQLNLENVVFPLEGAAGGAPRL